MDIPDNVQTTSSKLINKPRNKHMSMSMVESEGTTIQSQALNHQKSLPVFQQTFRNNFLAAGDVDLPLRAPTPADNGKEKDVKK